MGRTDRAERLIEASAARVYGALVDARALAEWLPPHGMTGRFEHFDARPGGAFRMVLTYADEGAEQAKSGAGQDVVEARFVELVPGERVAWAVDFVSDDPAFHGTMTMSWELAESGTGTRVAIRADDVPEGITAEDHAAGLASSLAGLAEYLGG